jgi:hypothetical protein
MIFSDHALKNLPANTKKPPGLAAVRMTCCNFQIARDPPAASELS